MGFWDLLAWIFWIFVFVAYLMVIFSIIGDLFRDDKLNGWWKAVWILFLIFVPFLTALVYLIARGKGMQERSIAQAQALQAAQQDYIRQTAGTATSPADEVAKAKALLDAGTITQAEFDSLKAKALSA
ncbi:SHOCT domain-containing protein [Microbacterium jejuense]|uniref:SHOCT domain-containing protein n=1 Tax=Microbacterium jejuense TaxID=1263637 RepID=A0ABS7HPI6_9MICO|nr:SHOCT domain-containing protein [Microbacterium jejuense]MBW9094877.1 SHOCT domain-containing protein [Microbacterium jejuense]